MQPLYSSSCAITYYLAHNPWAQQKLQKELDDAIGNEDDPVTTFQSTKSLPYLEAVINEALRMHSTSGIGLPRLAPEGGMVVCGKTFPEGSCLSVPTFTIHRDKAVWGEDCDDFRPERWFERDKNDIQKTFNPFSFGPRYVAVSSVVAEFSLAVQELRWSQPRFTGTPHYCRLDLPSV